MTNTNITNYLTQNITTQQYKSLQGQRTRFLDYLNVIEMLSLNDIKKVRKYLKENISESYDSKNIYIDIALIRDSFDYLLLKKDNRDNFDIVTLNDIIKSFYANAKLAENFEIIDSNFLIEKICKMLKKPILFKYIRTQKLLKKRVVNGVLSVGANKRYITHLLHKNFKPGRFLIKVNYSCMYGTCEKNYYI